MSERQKLIEKSLFYEGYFNYRDFFRVIDAWHRDKWFDKYEKRNEEFVKPDGTKQIELELTPWKKYTDYYRATLKIQLMVRNLKPVEIQQNGKMIKLHHGQIEMKINGYLIVDYSYLGRSKWEKKGKPLLFFIRDLWDKFVNVPYTQKYRELVISDVNDLYGFLTSYLNTAKYRVE